MDDDDWFDDDFDSLPDDWGQPTEPEFDEIPGLEPL